MKEPPPVLSNEEEMSIALNKGDAAKRLLTDPDFNAAYQELLDENLNSIVTSKPGQTELREDAYFRIRGIQEIAYKLGSWRTVADQVKAHIEAEKDPQGREQ